MTEDKGADEPSVRRVVVKVNGKSLRVFRSPNGTVFVETPSPDSLFDVVSARGGADDQPAHNDAAGKQPSR